MGMLGPADPPLAVTAYHTNVFQVKVNKQTLKTFKIETEESEQVFEV